MDNRVPRKRRTSRGRTPLFGTLRRALNLAAMAQRPGAPGLDALIERAQAGTLTRRRFLARSALAVGGAAAALTLPDLAWAQRKSAGGARIAVVGAGIAGLVAGWRLAAAGHDVRVYEANRRSGGRIISDTTTFGQGITVELGGSFINTDHADMLALCKELDLELEDGQTEADKKYVSETYFIGGRHYTTREIAEALKPFAARIEADRKAADADEAAEAALDRLSVAAYMDRLGMTGWLRDLYHIGYAQEMGSDVDAQSALYLVTTLVIDPGAGEAGLFGSDQRYQIEGGNGRLPAAIAAKLGNRIRLGHRLEAVRPRGAGYALTFARDGGAVDVDADLVVLALPFTTLRQCALELPLTRTQRRAIAELRYGTNAKVIAAVAQRPWRERGFGGNIISDAGFQAAWEDHKDLARAAGTVTFFAGGRDGIGFRAGTPDARARGFLAALDAAYPGVAAAYAGRATRMHWPSNPYAGGSYSCFGPGQWVPFTNAFPKPVGRVIFAGEQCSEEFSGYMNGGAETGRLAAEMALAVTK